MQSIQKNHQSVLYLKKKGKKEGEGNRNAALEFTSNDPSHKIKIASEYSWLLVATGICCAPNSWLVIFSLALTFNERQSSGYLSPFLTGEILRLHA